MPLRYPCAALHKKTALVAACLGLLCLLFSACVGSEENAARRGLTAHTVNDAPGMTVYLPPDWKIQDTTMAEAGVEYLRSQIPMPLPPMGTLLYATRTNAAGEAEAIFSLVRSENGGLTNDVLSAFTPEEKQELAKTLRFVTQGLYTQAGLPINIDSAAFTHIGRYEPLLFTATDADGRPFSSAAFFLAKDSLALSYMQLADNKTAAEAQAEFMRIMTAFEPDADYKPAPPPARNAGEEMLPYLMRVMSQGATQ